MAPGATTQSNQRKAAVVNEFLTSARETLRRDGELVLYRSRTESEKSRFLLVESGSAPPSLPSLKRLEHEYSLSGELDANWAARPSPLTEGRDERFSFWKTLAACHLVGF